MSDSTQTLQIGDITAEPGTKAQGFFDVPNTSVRMPISLVNGPKAGKTLLVTAGVHGGEYPCIDAAIRFAGELDAAQLSGQIIVVPIVSLNAFHARQAFVVPEDGKNINRNFPGKATGTTSERMAYALVNQVASLADVWVDLHGGDIPEALIPFVGYIDSGNADVDRQAHELATIFGIECLVQPGHLPGTTISAAAAMDMPALLAEAGQLGQWDEENSLILLHGCRNVARYLDILPGDVQPTPPLRVFKNWPWVRAEHTGCWYPSVKIGEHVQKDQVVGVIKDYFGNVLAEYRSPASGEVLLLFSSLAATTGDPLVGVAYA